jgi:hypothetical protein
MDTKKGKASTSQRYNLLPFAAFRPGGLEELVGTSFPAANIVFLSHSANYPEIMPGFPEIRPFRIGSLLHIEAVE